MDENSLISINGNGMPTLQILLMMTIISLLPSIVVMMTSFMRIVIILSFTRSAIGVQQTPPNMVLIGLALFLTLFIMNPVLKEINIPVSGSNIIIQTMEDATAGTIVGR